MTPFAAVAVTIALSTLMPIRAWQDCCMEGPDQTATKWSNAEADKANGYLNGWGLLARSPDFLSAPCTDCYKPSTFLHADSKTPNSLYPSSSGNPMCGNIIANGGGSSICQNHDYDGGVPTKCDSADTPWSYATAAVGFYKDTNDPNDDKSAASYGGGQVWCSGYYPTDSNAVDQRNLKNGLGLHATFLSQGNDKIDQDHACVNGKCITGTDTTGDAVGKCNYDDVPPSNFGDHFSESMKSEYNNNSPCRDGGKNPIFALDFVSCWFQNPFDAITAQNSLWNARSGWLNNMVPWIDGKGADQDDQAYWGWNEAPCTAQNGDMDDAKPDIMIVKLPPAAGFEPSACQLSDEADWDLAKQLNTAHAKGLGYLPIVWLGETKVGNGYEKSFFSQNFLFKDNSCIKTASDTDTQIYFYPSTDQHCKDYEAFVKDKCKWGASSFGALDGGNSGNASEPGSAGNTTTA